MKTNKRESCSLCNTKRKNMIKLACGTNTCGKCIEKCLVEDQSSKRYKCSNCSRSHNIRNEEIKRNVKQMLNKLNGTSKKEGVNKRKPRKINNFNADSSSSSSSSSSPSSDTETENKFVPVKFSSSRRTYCHVVEPMPEDYKKLAFDYNNCKTKPISKFNLNVVNKKGDALCVPIHDNKIVFSHETSLSIRDQNGKILKKVVVIRSPYERTTRMCINNRYIFISIENYKEEKTRLKKFDFSLQSYGGMDEEIFDSPCHSLAASNDRIFYTGIYGYMSNLHPMCYVLDCDTFDLIELLGYEIHSEDEKIYCLDKFCEGPKSHVYGNRVYFCYDLYYTDKYVRLDYANVDTFHYMGHYEMPIGFTSYKIDAKGNFVYYDHETKTLSVRSQKTKLLKRLDFDKQLENCLDFCITNDGRLVVIKSTFDIEIY